MNPTLLVMAGAAIGAAARYHLGRLLFHLGGPGFPYGTLAANLLGGLLMGLLIGTLARSNFVDEPWRLFLGVGLLGGFTTFSAFSLEVLNMIERGQWTIAIGYALISVIGSVLALFTGLLAVRAIA
ncbi:fluoride efflux transporter CrcB [Parasphingorhabdus sp.]|jgi:CrcB protein|uniref:fluoride efflux transporter CrcB n=1 Tax=Parasphingorhabdus sp. TaxID=2709688 RepID=UPI003D2BDA08